MKRTLDFLLVEYLGAISRRLDVLEAQRERIMATIEEVQTKLGEIEAAVAEERTEVQGLLEGLRTQIQALQDQVASGQLVAQEQIDGLAATADSIISRVRDISEPVPVEG